MNILISAVQFSVNLAFRIALFPFTYVCFPIVRFFYGFVNHLLLIPVLLICRTFIYGFIYIPLLPLLKATGIEHDTLVPVEVSLYRLAIGFLPHFLVFLYHFIHYFMVSLFVGSFVGMIAGLNISIVARILYLPEVKDELKSKRNGDFAAGAAHSWKRVKWEPERTHASSSPQKATKDKKVTESPAVKIENPKYKLPELSDFSSEAIFEDDDGYNFMNYKISNEQRKHIKKVNFIKRRESRYRAPPPSLQVTIEEESESEITPTPTHATSAVFPTNHVSLDYATGTIGSSKTISTESSVFSKKIGAVRSELKDSTLPDSAGDETDVSATAAEVPLASRNERPLKTSSPREKPHGKYVDAEESADLDADVTFTREHENSLKQSSNTKPTRDETSEK